MCFNYNMNTSFPPPFPFLPPNLLSLVPSLPLILIVFFLLIMVTNTEGETNIHISTNAIGSVHFVLLVCI